MINFFQVLFLVAAIILLVLNVIDYNKYMESKRHADAKPHHVKWFQLILTSVVALGCAVNIIIWISNR